VNIEKSNYPAKKQTVNKYLTLNVSLLAYRGHDQIAVVQQHNQYNT